MRAPPLLVVVVVLSSAATLLSSCERECSTQNDCPDTAYCTGEGECAPAIVLPDAGPQSGGVGYVPSGGARVDGGTPASSGGSGGVGGVGGSAGTPGAGGGTMPSYGPDHCGAECLSDYDCTTTPDDPLYGVGNYRCWQGACLYTGCTSNQDCIDAYGEWWPQCDLNAWPWAQCQFRCNDASDCGWGDVLFDDDNWACTSGVCQYQGCGSDLECEQFWNLEDLRCARMPYQQVSSCWYACADDSDCYANEACYNGACGWLGCSEGGCGAGALCVTPP